MPARPSGRALPARRRGGRSRGPLRSRLKAYISLWRAVACTRHIVPHARRLTLLNPHPASFHRRHQPRRMGRLRRGPQPIRQPRSSSRPSRIAARPGRAPAGCRSTRRCGTARAVCLLPRRCMQSPTATANTCSTMAGPMRLSRLAAHTTPSCRSPFRFPPCPARACSAAPAPACRPRRWPRPWCRPASSSSCPAST